ncbi:MAG TPA: hypothetical protein VFI49_08360 [Rudaea sp.]|nr:hypothetical protein [Rudaea sp.]
MLIAVPAPWAQGDMLALAGSSNAASVVTLAAGDEIFPGGFEQMFSLTIDDILAWCDVSVNGGAPTSAPPASSFEQGRVIPLHGDTANATYFVWGFWTGTDGGATDTKMDTTVTMSADRSITVCCPDIGFATCP